MVNYGRIKKSPHHDHPLVLKKDLNLFTCDGCLEIGLGDGYTCENSKCDFQLHKQCAKDLNTVIRSINFDCNFVFLNQPQKMVVCSICGDAINRYVYCCKDNGCQINLHPVCAELPRYITIDQIDYEIEQKMKIKCTRCNYTKIPQVKDIWAYRSSKAKQHYHVWCMKKLVVEKWEEATISCTTQIAPLKYAETSTSRGRFFKGKSKIISKMEMFEKCLGVLGSLACAVLGFSGALIGVSPGLIAAPTRQLLLKEH